MSYFLSQPPRMRALAALLCLCLLLTAAPLTLARVTAPKYDEARNRMLAYMLSRHLPDQHVSHKPMDDDLSRAAFDLYLKQLDPRKRFLRQRDVRALRTYELSIDDELRSGKLDLPLFGEKLLAERIDAVEKMVDELFEEEIDITAPGDLETDPDKRDYAENDADLRGLWRRFIQLQVASNYLDLLEERQAGKREAADAKGPGKPEAGPGGEQEAGDQAETRQPDERPDGDQPGGGRDAHGGGSATGRPGEDPPPELDVSGPLDQEMLAEARKKAKKRFRNTFHRLRQETRQDHVDRFFNAVARAYDPHTEYMPPTSKEDFDIHMRGSLEGIGALLREEDGYIKVVRIIPGSAAERQGQLQAEDVILAVAEKDAEPVDITDMRLREAVTLIRGPKGTEVRLTVRKPDGRKVEIAIVRDVVNIEETYVKGEVIAAPDGRKVGYLRIPSFYRDFSGHAGRNVTDDVRAELGRFEEQGIKALIIDLRDDGGGSLGDAVDVTGLFIPGGPVVQVRDAGGAIEVLEDPDPAVRYGGPIIVLVNKFSASASEILAAALQDYRRALIVGGKHTHGKGTVQAVMDMNRYVPILHVRRYDDLGALKITVQKFYRINGRSTQFDGVTPDIVLPDVLEHLESGEKSLDYPLPGGQVEPLRHTLWDGMRIDLDKARRESAARVAADPKFQEISRKSRRILERREHSRQGIDLATLARLRREDRDLNSDKGMGRLPGDQDPDGKEKKSLHEQLADDPYVQEALRLFAYFQ